MWQRLAIIFLILPCLAFSQGPYSHQGAAAGGKITTASLKDLKKMEAYQVATKAAYTKKPSAKTKKDYVAATVKYGTACMNSEALDRKIKYKKALGLYREALKVDPTNAEAKENAKMIEDVYRSMGRPVP